MLIEYYKDLFPINLPIAKDYEFWNGRPDEFNNIGYGLDYSQEFGMTPYAKKGIYGQLNGKLRPHNGHDFAGVKNTPLVAPCKCWATYIGYDKRGYGNFIFFETETKKINGENIKMEFVLGHAIRITAKINQWYNPGDQLGLMGSTGMSTGTHTHFGGRPLIRKGNNFVHLLKDDGARGYIDLTDFFIIKPIYNKQLLLNEVMKLIRKKGEKDIYAISPDGRANLIINWATYQQGLTMKLWEDDVKEVNELPPKLSIIILTPNN